MKGCHGQEIDVTDSLPVTCVKMGEGGYPCSVATLWGGGGVNKASDKNNHNKVTPQKVTLLKMQFWTYP